MTSRWKRERDRDTDRQTDHLVRPRLGHGTGLFLVSVLASAGTVGKYRVDTSLFCQLSFILGGTAAAGSFQNNLYFCSQVGKGFLYPSFPSGEPHPCWMNAKYIAQIQVQIKCSCLEFQRLAEKWLYGWRWGSHTGSA